MHFDETAFATRNIFLFNFTDRSAFFKFHLLAVEFAFLTLHSQWQKHCSNDQNQLHNFEVFLRQLKKKKKGGSLVTDENLKERNKLIFPPSKCRMERNYCDQKNFHHVKFVNMLWNCKMQKGKKQHQLQRSNFLKGRRNN